ncbi:MAG: 4-hydroxythreonine-4-phosphate dehydrogenase PdxA [Rhodobiaceae bacterium]|nr:4-hydroxythreonine-4-phosphate dehydrogenase PdxA [Rhodobiaceae bacterium]MCC0056504.1 4-hydroxythreonine-4-phosphate dehydrogenase PdxA [Rhodobiaceae bacterium]
MSPAPIAITMGEPAGVGPELIGRAWTHYSASGACPFFVVGVPEIISARLEETRQHIPLKVHRGAGAPVPTPEHLTIVPPEGALLSDGVRAGVPTAASAGAVTGSIEKAVSLVREGAASAVVTAPIAKEVLYGAGFVFPGHTEFLGALAERHWGGKFRPVMMLASDELRVVPVTVHIPLSDVPTRLTSDLIVETGRIVARDLERRFAVPMPRIAVCGLNPHAGEGGTMGTEDRDIIVPAVAKLRAEGVDIIGPLPADTMFHPRARATYDAVLAMYHDQALIPIKTLSFDEAVNVTLGLPFVRTSPDHGTAFDIAGKGVARPDSLIAAIALAGKLAAAPTP